MMKDWVLVCFPNIPPLNERAPVVLTKIRGRTVPDLYWIHRSWIATAPRATETTDVHG